MCTYWRASIGQQMIVSCFFILGHSIQSGKTQPSPSIDETNEGQNSRTYLNRKELDQKPANLEICPPSAIFLRIHSPEFGASLWIDGMRVGSLPLKGYCSSPGLHLFSVIRPSRADDLLEGVSAHDQQRRASQLLWVPSGASWVIDLSHLRLKPQVLIQKSQSNRSKKDRSSPDISKAIKSIRRANTSRPQGELTLVSGLSQESFTLRTPLANHSSVKNQLFKPHYSNLINTQGLYYTSNERLDVAQGVNLSLKVFTYQNLYRGSLSLDQVSPWGSSELRLFWREALVHYGASSDRLGEMNISVGRHVLKIAQRSLIGDGIRLMSRHTLQEWTMSPRVSLIMDRSASLERLVMKSSELKDEFWGRIGLTGIRKVHDGFLSIGASLLKDLRPHLQHNLTSDLYMGLIEWKSSALWGRGEVALRSHQWLSQLNMASGWRSSAREIALKLSTDYRAGDEWDQRWLPGAYRPLILDSSLWSTSAHLFKSQAQAQIKYSRGQAPLWQSNLSTPSQYGDAWRVILHWGSTVGGQVSLRNDHSLNRLDQGRVNGHGLSLRYTQYELRGGARRWGLAPWATREAIHQNRLSALSMGWVQKVRPTLVEGLSLGALLSKSIEGNLWWPEVELSWRKDRLSFSAFCGKPLDVMGLLAPNFWHTRCGMKLVISSLIKP